VAGITDLITAIGDENIIFQKLSNSMTQYKLSKKHGDGEITFCTDPSNIDEGKEAIIVWVDKKLFNECLTEVTKR